MKNKILISFFINLLIGLLFSFPVFSAHNDIQPSSLSVIESGITVNDLSLNSDFVSGDKKISFTGESRKEISKKKIIKRNLLPGNKGNSDYIISYPADFFFFHYFKATKYQTSSFVNLSFLKELRIIKMLC